MMKIIKIFSVFLFLITIIINKAQADKSIITSNNLSNEIKAIRAAKYEKSNKIRFVIETNKNANFKSFLLQNPPRVVIDIDSGKWNLKDKPILDNLARNVRFAEKANDKLRVVIDLLSSAKKITKQQLTPETKQENYKIILDVLFTKKDAVTESKTAKPVKLIKITPENSSKKDIFSIVKDSDYEMSSEEMSLNQKPKVKKIIVAIDAGHGGEDPGAIGRSYRTYEKHITFKYAKALQKKLNASKKYRAILTREGDYYMKLKSRVQKAKKHKAQVFISIHADSSPNRKARGMSVYTLSEKASDRESARLASKENKADFIKKPDLKSESSEVLSMLFDLAKRSKNNQSTKLAKGLVKEMKQHIKLMKNTHRFAGFRVLRGSDIPSVLIELGYLSNRQDEKLLRSSKAHRNNFSAGVKKSLDSYFFN